MLKKTEIPVQVVTMAGKLTLLFLWNEAVTPTAIHSLYRHPDQLQRILEVVHVQQQLQLELPHWFGAQNQVSLKHKYT